MTVKRIGIMPRCMADKRHLSPGDTGDKNSGKERKQDGIFKRTFGRNTLYTAG